MTSGRTLAGQVLVLQLAVVGVVLVIVGLISLRQSTVTFSDERGSAMRAVAENVANVSVVRARIGEVGATRQLAPTVDRAVALSGATDVSVADPDGRIIASSDPERVETVADLGDSDVQQGRGWSGDLEVDGERTVSAHAPILSDDGTLVGLAMADQAYPSLWDRLADDATDLAVFLGVGALLGIVGTWWVSRVLKRRTQGMRTIEIAALADQRDALLHSIGEGVVAVDPDGRLTVLNDSAADLLGLSPDAVGRLLDDLPLDAEVRALLRDGDGGDAHDAVVLVGERVLVVNRRSARSRGRGIGSVTTMRDRTELVSMRRQLSSNLTITDTLRAQTHEFANRLHTISGLVELREYEELSLLLGTLTRERAAVEDDVRTRVEDPAVAALLVGKASAASEVGVRLVVEESARLPTLERSLSADVTTVVGNLVDNAVDASRGTPGARVLVSLTHEVGTVDVEVSDDGPGVPDDLRDAIFSRGFSTKPEVLGGRGIGLPLVRVIAARRQGEARLVDDGRAGARFRVTLRTEHAGE